jgi:hypothetical protein
MALYEIREASKAFLAAAFKALESERVLPTTHGPRRAFDAIAALSTERDAAGHS